MTLQEGSRAVCKAAAAGQNAAGQRGLLCSSLAAGSQAGAPALDRAGCSAACSRLPARPAPCLAAPPLPLLKPALPPSSPLPPCCSPAEDEARWFFQQLAVGLSYFHSIGVDNRELNLNNKLLTGDATRPLLKINDFTYRWVGGWVGGCVWGARRGFLVGTCAVPTTLSFALPAPASRPSPDPASSPHPLRLALPPCCCCCCCCCSKSEQINSDPNSALGSLPYTAPEVLSNTMRHGHQADVWSLGVALYKMCVGLYPFERLIDATDSRTAVQVSQGGGGETGGLGGCLGGDAVAQPSRGRQPAPHQPAARRKFIPMLPPPAPHPSPHPWLAAECAEPHRACGVRDSQDHEPRAAGPARVGVHADVHAVGCI